MSKRTCTITGCVKPHRAKGLCATHYNQAHQPNRHPKKLVPCAFCGTEVSKGTGGGRVHGAVCSNQCRTDLANPPKSTLPLDHPARWYGSTSSWPRWNDRWEAWSLGYSPLRVAHESGNDAALIDAVKADCKVNDNGCWIWQRAIKDGYATVNIASKSFLVHRLTLEAKHARKLGRQSAHHICATTQCVNPEHLQPVSHRENNAEMMQRNYYVQRIRDLEVALASLAPNHPRLAFIGLPRPVDNSDY